MVKKFGYVSGSSYIYVLIIKVMLYTLKVHVEHGHTENIWSGNDINDAHHYESIAIKHWGKDNVWICDNIQEIAVG